MGRACWGVQQQQWVTSEGWAGLACSLCSSGTFPNAGRGLLGHAGQCGTSCVQVGLAEECWCSGWLHPGCEASLLWMTGGHSVCWGCLGLSWSCETLRLTWALGSDLSTCGLWLGGGQMLLSWGAAGLSPVIFLPGGLLQLHPPGSKGDTSLSLDTQGMKT